MKITRAGDYNSHMLRIGRDLRGFTTRELAKATGIKFKVLNGYCAGETPTEDDMKSISEVLQFPISFFHREGTYPRRDTRYPPDMYVTLPEEPEPTRQEAIDLIQYVPDSEIAALVAYMREIADYGEKVTRLFAERDE